MKRTIWIPVLATIVLLGVPGAVQAARGIRWSAWLASFPVGTFDHPILGWSALALVGLGVLVGLLPRGREHRIVRMHRRGWGVPTIARRMDIAQDAVRGLLGSESLVPVAVGAEDRSGRKESPPPRRPRRRASVRRKRSRGEALRAELMLRGAGGTPLAGKLAVGRAE